ncbi:MAG: hypothetical protein JRG97_15185 [Deltaproteobacteria bacterium]|nr:hypothetical protein [Deltaproteobacteria bacterium]MBW2053752.1 hypothetical protein [Deltaproteobacteria bacterium]MBW2142381.1 hypothetical protein [Deltaproteobacteria bacterium]MBW2324240.1 hypothetical protein [Deltaproteobacteria bacterium]
MKKNKHNTSNRSSWLSLELFIILSLTLKMTLTGGYFLSITKGTSVIKPSVAIAADQSQEQKAAPYTLETLQSPKDLSLIEQYKAILLVLRSKDKRLNEKEQRLREKEEALKALEKETQKRAVELTARLSKLIKQKEELTVKLEKLIEEQKALEDAKINHLVKAYSAMRPENAATLVNSCEDNVAVRILGFMNGRSAGKILAFVEPVKAARLTKILANHKGNVRPPVEK